MLVTWDILQRMSAHSAFMHTCWKFQSCAIQVLFVTVLRMLIHRSQSVCNHAHKCNFTIISVPERLHGSGCSISLNPHSSSVELQTTPPAFHRIRLTRIQRNIKKLGFSCLNVFVVWQRLMQNTSLYNVWLSSYVCMKLIAPDSLFRPYWYDSICIRCVLKNP